MDEKVTYWLELADYDLATAGALLEKERFLYVGFMCRYPEYKDALLRKMDSEYTKSILTRTEELYAWIKAKLS